MAHEMRLGFVTDTERSAGSSANFPVTGSSRRLELPRRDEFSAAQKFFQRLAEDSVPTFERGQLLRSLSQFAEEAGDAGECPPGRGDVRRDCW